MLLCSPQGQPLPANLTHTPRPASLEGLRIGFLDNTKAPVDLIHRYLAARVSERVRGTQVFHIAKQHPSLPAEPAVLEALVANADVVINALGD
jgi:hypothetical protein